MKEALGWTNPTGPKKLLPTNTMIHRGENGGEVDTNITMETEK